MSTTVAVRHRLPTCVQGQLAMIFAEKPTLPPVTHLPPELLPAPGSNERSPDSEYESSPPAPLKDVTPKDATPETTADPVQTLEDVAARILAASWPKHKIAETISGLRTLSRGLDRPLAAIPADPAQLRQILAAASAASTGITPNRWARSRGLAIRALAATGIAVMPGRSITGLSVAWQDLYDRLPDKKCRYGLSRILNFCCREAVEPDAFDESVFDRFSAALRTASLHPRPETVIRTTARLWGVAAHRVPGWPRIASKAEKSGRLYALAPDAFPASFGDDLTAFLEHSGNQDPLADDFGPSVRPSTVAMRRKQILQIASALVLSGLPIGQITSLGALTNQVNAEAALRALLSRKRGATTPYLGQQAQLLRTIAKHWVKADVDELQVLARFSSRLAIKRRWMVPKNRARLRQFDSPENLRALLSLPARVFQEVGRGKSSDRKSALRVMLAFAVELLIVAPMRIDNLTGLDVERHIVVVQGARGETRHIVIPADDTKMATPFEMELPAESLRLLTQYLSAFRPLLCAVENQWLFPGPAGQRGSTVSFSTAISRFIRRETGFVMNVHLFRHLAGKVHLTAHPEDIETVRRVLGHSSSATIIRAYSELRTDQAFQRYDATVSRLRDEERRTPRPRISHRGRDKRA
jgi:integrase